MKFTIQSSLLKNKLNIAGKFISQKNLMPILDCFLIECDGDNIWITAGDDEKSMTLTVPIENGDKGKFCIPSKKIMDSLKNLGDQPLNFTYNENTREILATHTTGTFSLIGGEAEQYPTVAKTEATKTFTMSSDLLSNGLNLCVNAAAEDEIRKVMSCVCVDIKKDGVTSVATDGRKLIRHINREKQFDDEASLLLPKKIAATLRNILPSKGDVNLELCGDKLYITLDDMEISLRLPEGSYVNYNAVIPTDCTHIGTVEREKLIKALKRSGVFCSKDNGLIKFEMSDNAIKISAKDSDFNTSSEEQLSCEYIDEAIAIGLNCYYVQEMISALECEKISLGISEPSRPMLIKPTEEDGETSIIIMPMIL